jgi:hypothetical protein
MLSVVQKRLRSEIVNALHSGLPVTELSHIIGDYSDFYSGTGPLFSSCVFVSDNVHPSLFFCFRNRGDG